MEGQTGSKPETGEDQVPLGRKNRQEIKNRPVGHVVPPPDPEHG